MSFFSQGFGGFEGFEEAFGGIITGTPNGSEVLTIQASGNIYNYVGDTATSDFQTSQLYANAARLDLATPLPSPPINKVNLNQSNAVSSVTSDDSDGTYIIGAVLNIKVVFQDTVNKGDTVTGANTWVG